MSDEVPEVGIEDVNASGDAEKQKMLDTIQKHYQEVLDLATLPSEVKRRIKALKKLQFEMLNIESDFYREVHELECKYASRYEPIFNKRAEIVTGSLEPTDSDCDWESDEEDELSQSLKDKAAITNEVDSDEKKEPVSGIPSFWVTVFKNVELLRDMVQEHDEPILQHLRDIKVKFLESNPIGFKLEFFFDKNEFFSNGVLTKEYHMRAEPDKEDPFSYEGPEIIKCFGCDIDWVKGKDVTVRVIKKTQKHKNRGVKRTITKTVANDSFFNFFKPPTPPEKDEGEEGEDDDEDEDQDALLAADFEIGHYIRERIVPRAVLYFTGEAVDDEYDDSDDDEEDESGEEEEDEDGDGDYKPGAATDQKAPDCKQQ